MPLDTPNVKFAVELRRPVYEFPHYGDEDSDTTDPEAASDRSWTPKEALPMKLLDQVIDIRIPIGEDDSRCNNRESGSVQKVGRHVLRDQSSDAHHNREDA